MKRIHLLTFVALVWLAACSPPPVAGPELRLGLSPAAAPLHIAIGACVPAAEGLQVRILTLYPEHADLAELDLYFRLGEPDEEAGFAAQVAWEEIALALPASNPARLSAAQVAGLFVGRIEGWSEL
ncbi:MAG: hypothetical protein KIS85_09705, partial [Anaerolineales bacterium]|nr:hypothetical protein [Anaerolineales bacterium]